MTEKELIKKLNTFKSISPDPAWKEQSRNILISQITSGQASQTENSFGFVFVLESVLRRIASPMAVSVFILMFLVAGGFLSVNFAQDSRPGDSFYIAKIVSEKAQLALTFDESKKVHLGLGFAVKRAAELDKVMNEEVDDGSKEERIARLKDDIRRELSVAKERLETISLRQIQPETESVEAPSGADEEGAIFTANLEKEDNGLETSDNLNSSQEADTAQDGEKAEGSEDTVEIRVTIEKDATSTPTKELLEEANELIKQEDYSAAIDKLNKVDESIDAVYDTGEAGGSEAENKDSGEVLGAEEGSTTTAEVGN